jgi:hypothetical protein
MRYLSLWPVAGPAAVACLAALALLRRLARLAGSRPRRGPGLAEAVRRHPAGRAAFRLPPPDIAGVLALTAEEEAGFWLSVADLRQEPLPAPGEDR